MIPQLRIYQGSKMTNQQAPIQVTITPVTPYAQNCSIIQCNETKECVVVDPGGQIDELLEKIEQIQGKLVGIWVTHAHIDHVGGVSIMHKKTQVPITGPHEADQFWIDGLENQNQMLGGMFPGVKAFKPDRWLQDNDKVTVGKQTFQVIHVPGHTPGHVAFYHKESGIAFVGDIIFERSVGRTDFPQSNHNDLIYGIKHKLIPLGDDVVFVPGHGPTSTFGDEKRHNPFLKD